MREITYREALREALREEMIRSPEVFVMGEDAGVFGGIFGVTAGLMAEFGEERVLDTPISEAGIAGAAVGAAMVGMRPVAEIMFVDFLTIAMDQLVNQAAKWHYMSGGKLKVPMVVRTPTGTGRRTGAQHSQSLEAWVAHVPGLKVVMPATPYDAKGLLKAAIRDDNPVVFIEHKMLYNDKGPVPEEEYLVPLGKAKVAREGRDVTIVATSLMVKRALQAASALAEEGIEAEVVDPRTLRPLDIDTIIASVQKTGKLLIVHEATTFCGFGAEIAAQVAEKALYSLDAPIARLGAWEVPIPFSPSLEDRVVPRVEDIVERARTLVRENI
ncbi:alpha-ketoacid dehydrogenase subunit beta [Thermanaeromonas sp. C210]|uniref:alpha-ketoacid dehydrogenase subunit beta n=1 Tax=Thermanaeromonas sp. C210 TaxID=2731925 RepID=UPI00155BDACE|nr:alpha-ketoacid dehydrogenase subunit beta [Thermanaeromonas sp. C210]GFN24173.1 TPP-dependent acetoin dehydrogenase complex, E1 protein subunit beta [Thermanaeromonas sp. C210]